MIHGKDLAWGEIVIHHSHGVPTEEYIIVFVCSEDHMFYKLAVPGKGEQNKGKK